MNWIDSMINMSYCRTINVVEALDEWLKLGAGDLNKKTAKELLEKCYEVIEECEQVIGLDAE